MAEVGVGAGGVNITLLDFSAFRDLRVVGPAGVTTQVSFRSGLGDTLKITGSFGSFDANGVPRTGTITQVQVFSGPDSIFVAGFDRINVPVAQFLDGLPTVHQDQYGILLGGPDHLLGGDGNDSMNAGQGSDTVEGGLGNDWLWDGYGAGDRLLGGPGNDWLAVARDFLAGSAYLDGGPGNDQFSVTSNKWGDQIFLTATVLGGDGNDALEIFGSVRVTADLGSGDDRIRYTGRESQYGRASEITARLGSGVDTIGFDWAVDEFPALATFQDFQTGDAGDIVEIYQLRYRLAGWDESNPFPTGYLRIQQDGSASLLQVDLDGGGDNFRSIMRFENATASAFTAHNLLGYSPTGGAPPGQVINGQVGSEHPQVIGGLGSDTLTGMWDGEWIEGKAGSDLINAAGGRDFVYAGEGADTVFAGDGDDEVDGGGGNDYLRGDAGADYLQGRAGFDDMNGNMGDDWVVGGDGDDWVVGGKDNDVLWGEAGDDIVYGNLGADTGDGGVENDLVRGGQGDDSIAGGAGDDWMSGDRGADTVAGGVGADVFHTFSDAGLDRVLDFNRGEGDRVMVDPGTTYTVAQVGPDVVIDMGGANQMVLVGVSQGSLTGAWIYGA